MTPRAVHHRTGITRLAGAAIAILSALAVVATAQPAASQPTTNGSRRVTFVNAVHHTIWVAASPDAAHPLRATGWVLRAGRSVTITVPNKWNGRFWGRTGCVFRHGASNHGRGHCQTGDCGGRFQCTAWGTIPATLAEYNPTRGTASTSTTSAWSTARTCRCTST